MTTHDRPAELDHLMDKLCHLLGETIPDWTPLLKELAPELLLQLHASELDSLGRAGSTLPQKHRHLIALAAALATSKATCTRAQAHLAILAGASEDELLDVVRIVRHMAASGVLDSAEPLLKDMAARKRG